MTRSPSQVEHRPKVPGAAARRRPISVLDLLILVGATAFGLALVRTLPAFLAFEERSHMITAIHANGWRSRGVETWTHVLAKAGARPLAERPSYWLGHLPYWSGPCLLSWSIATTGLALRGRARSRRRVLARAGPVAALAGALALMLVVSRCLQAVPVNRTSWSSLWVNRESLWNYSWIALPRLAGFGVAAAWMALWICGRRPRRPDGPERLGQAVGWAWIAMGVSGEVGVWCFTAYQ